MNPHIALRNHIELMLQTRFSKFQAQWAKNLEVLQESQRAQLEVYKVYIVTVEDRMATARRQRREEFERLHLAELNAFFEGNPDLSDVEEFSKGWVQTSHIFYAELHAVLDADYQKLHRLSDAFYAGLRSQYDQFDRQFATACSEFCTEVAEQIIQMLKA
jgi:hypothetical protein